MIDAASLLRCSYVAASLSSLAAAAAATLQRQQQQQEASGSATAAGAKSPGGVHQRNSLHPSHTTSAPLATGTVRCTAPDAPGSKHPPMGPPSTSSTATGTNASSTADALTREPPGPPACPSAPPAPLSGAPAFMAAVSELLPSLHLSLRGLSLAVVLSECQAVLLSATATAATGSTQQQGGSTHSLSLHLNDLALRAIRLGRGEPGAGRRATAGGEEEEEEEEENAADGNILRAVAASVVLRRQAPGPVIARGGVDEQQSQQAGSRRGGFQSIGRIQIQDGEHTFEGQDCVCSEWGDAVTGSLDISAVDVALTLAEVQVRSKSRPWRRAVWGPCYV